MLWLLGFRYVVGFEVYGFFLLNKLLYRIKGLDIIWIQDYNGYGLEDLCVIISRKEMIRVINCMVSRGHKGSKI